MNPFTFFQGYIPQPNEYFIEGSQTQQPTPFGSYAYTRQVDEFGFDLFPQQAQSVQHEEPNYESFHPHIRQHFDYDAGSYQPQFFEQQYTQPLPMQWNQHGHFPHQHASVEENRDHLEHNQQDLNDPDRQPNLERRINKLERENEQQSREIERLNRENNQQQRAIERLNNQNEQQNQSIERLNRRLNRVNQRLRAVENKLSIVFTPYEGGF